MLPRHVAIIMDGNGRWAKKRLLPRYAGHKSGVGSVRQIVESCGEKGIEALTLFAFSSENWRRPAKEVSVLMDLFLTTLNKEAAKLHKNNVRLQIIGARDAFSEKLQQCIQEGEALTQNNSGLILTIAANYGGRWDIVETVKSIAAQAKNGELPVQDITPELFNSQLCLADLPPPDLFIRTGGEKRISNFLLWQLAYTELYFTDILWPDFDSNAFEDALASFAKRQRRFGRTGDQVAENA
ncbi:MAG: isoprenyl transferase [Gammaproteobacteria bacterium]|nr:isoprenyl transferase [Gammaproteobacteria bacterium]